MHLLRPFTLVMLFPMAVWAEDKSSALEVDTAGYERKIAPFFAKYCNQCHVGDKPKGGFGLDRQRLPLDFSDPIALGRWREVVNVLNSHEMPPKKEKHPQASEVAAVVDWITEQAVRVELAKRSSTVVLRRLNRAEYKNTIRDLLGVDFDVSVFPQDPPAGGFDNNGEALTLSPLHIETYLNAAKQILDRALVEGEKPKTIRWRFHPKVGMMDTMRVRLDDQNNPLVNGNNNKQEGEWVVIHHNQWDKVVNARDFRVPVAGDYIIRLRAAGRVPTRRDVVKSVEPLLAKRRQEQNAQAPNAKRIHDEQYQQDLEHFKTDRMYDYGPPRLKLVCWIGPQPRVISEFDLDGTPDKPKIHEFRVRFPSDYAAIQWEYAYNLPSVLENFWVQQHDTFARPEAMIHWFEIEGPVFDAWPPKSHTSILHDIPLRTSDERKYAYEVLQRFMYKAYRRPVSDSEVQAKLKYFDLARQDGASFVQAIKRPLTAILTSPHFLFLVEAERDGKQKLNDYEWAARLSYFLWSSTPDEELLRLAAAGKLSDRAERLRQVERLLRDLKAEAFASNFAGQWAGASRCGEESPCPRPVPKLRSPLGNQHSSRE